ncbi:BQ2448_3751 [Microbotryum intermedium]|uniref:BQ2448_3751 protein n=1 Tax=Microbotryum intermedium TaxID=269621 RepID=A0A238FDX1_9BASI|nr:BQ2448_3751 [Microbotryum intermedium]
MTSSSSSKSIVAVENAQQRLQRLHDTTKLYYSHGRIPARPTSKTELDVLKEHHRFIRSEQSSSSGGNGDGAPSLSWEDQLAEKYYQSLFREFALADLKHYKVGAIALRWRTEEEVISGIGNLTCASLRCEYHQPDPSLTSDPNTMEHKVEEEDLPLVSTRLTEQEMWFGYIEEGVKKSALVKVVLCRRCERKLNKGREVAKRMREGTEAGVEVSRSPRDRGERQDRDEERVEEQDVDDDGDDFAPKLPPELAKDRGWAKFRRREHEDSAASRSKHRRRSASPESRRR